MLLTLLIATQVDAAVLRVGSSNEAGHRTIREALEESQPGDLIEVEAGSYTECLHIDQDKLTIQSIAGSDQTTIDGRGLCRNAVAIIDSRDITLVGFTITNAPARGLLASYSTVSLKDVRLAWNGSTRIMGSGGFIEGGAVSLEQCELFGNVAYFGGNLYITDGARVLLKDSDAGISWAYYAPNIFAAGSNDSDPVELINEHSSIRASDSSQLSVSERPIYCRSVDQADKLLEGARNAQQTIPCKRRLKQP